MHESRCHHWLAITVLLGLMACYTTPVDGQIGPERPDIVLIVIDDLGWTDLSCQNSDWYQTPRIDQIAARGTRFTDAYAAAPNCAPSRASLMTGLYTPRHGIYTVRPSNRGKAEHRSLHAPPTARSLPAELTTIAETLQDRGYTTAHLGKWHLGSLGEGDPTHHGFEINVGGIQKGHPPSGYFVPYENAALPDGPEGEYLTDRLGDEAAAIIRTQERSTPLFMSMCFFSVHTPIQAREEDEAVYRAREPGRYHDRADYAGMIHAVDRNVGKILDAIEESGRADSAVVIFTSDNGGVGGYEDAGLDVRGYNEITHQHPLRGGKGMMYEGGIRVPLLIHVPWLDNRPPTSGTPAHHVDLAPTIADLAGTAQPGDGTSLMPVLSGQTPGLDRASLFWHFPAYLNTNRDGIWRTTPASAIRKGDWKLIRWYENDRVELYDLAADIGEDNDLSNMHQELVAELRSELARWLEQTEAAMPERIPDD